MIDTSAVIDGRIVDIARTGFILGQLVVPRFVLDELQRIADSPDAMRRNRGRRGLEMLSALQKDAVTPVEISEGTYPEVPEVDAKLMAYARNDKLFADGADQADGHDRRGAGAELLDLEGACAVVATIGTTSSTAIDPVPAIADACASWASRTEFSRSGLLNSRMTLVGVTVAPG